MIAFAEQGGRNTKGDLGSAIGKSISLDESGQDASPAEVEMSFGLIIWCRRNFDNWAGRGERDSYHLPRGMEQPGSSRGS